MSLLSKNLRGLRRNSGNVGKVAAALPILATGGQAASPLIALGGLGGIQAKQNELAREDLLHANERAEGIGAQDVAFQKEILDMLREDSAPFRETAQNVLPELQQLATDPNSVLESPVFQNEINALTRLIQNNAAASGTLNSPDTILNLLNNYSNVKSNFVNNRFNRLSSLVGLRGDNTTIPQASNISNARNRLMQLAINRGDINAGTRANNVNIINDTLGNLLNLVGLAG